jgi:hypothetical protein
LVAGLVVGGFIGVVIVLYAADRIVKARAQVRRLRSMSERLATATARAEEQHQQRQAEERRSSGRRSLCPACGGTAWHGPGPVRSAPGTTMADPLMRARALPAPVSMRPGPAGRHNGDQSPAASSPVAIARTRPGGRQSP